MEICKGFIRNELGEWIKLSLFIYFRIKIVDGFISIVGQYDDSNLELEVIDSGFKDENEAQSCLDKAFRTME